MAADIEAALAHRGILVAESGTGTGKTYAYLVPVLLSDKRVLISTGTRHLQDQLFSRDLPQLTAVLGQAPDIALLKGRANYLCTYRLALGSEAPAELQRQRGIIARWRERTVTGDVGELEGIPEDSPIWPRVTSNVDNCLGAACPDYDGCFVARARKQALEAEVVIVNHHLFFADLALKKDGFGQLLPGVDGVVFDEAHQLPNVASQFFATSVSSHQLLDLCSDVRDEGHLAGGGVEGLLDGNQALAATVAEARASDIEDGRWPWDAVANDAAWGARIEQVKDRLATLCGDLEAAAPVSEGLHRLSVRAQDLLGRVYTVLETDNTAVRWLEFTPRAFRLHSTPIDVGRLLQPYFDRRDKAWVFTSATLTVAGRFDHFCARMGLSDAEQARWDSPFDFRTQTLLYLPQGLPDPRSGAYGEAVYAAVLPVLQASGGRSFWLFTSHRALNEAHRRIAGADFNVLVQGSAPRAKLLDQFRDTPRAVLLGTHSFWEGVDVRGEALSCVIIDKLPFEPPDDPVTQARLKAIEVSGGNPFTEYQLPNAVISVKQGVGRLIRDRRDRGVLVLCDPRVLSKSYGRVFLDSLPPMPRTHDFGAVQAFFSAAP